MERRSVTVAIPVFNEERNVPALLNRLMPVMRSLGRSFEVIFVDDGSRDGTLPLLSAAAERDPDHIRVIELSRNFGQHPALLAAFRFARGEAVITLDADLQNPPEQIPALLAKLDEGFDSVGGVRRNRRDSWFRRKASQLINRLTASITGLHLEDIGCMLRGYSRDLVEQINRCEEKATFIPALALRFARRHIDIPVEHSARAAGKSKYSFYRLIRLNFDLMTGFSGRIYRQVRGRPRYSVRRVHGSAAGREAVIR